MAKKTKKRAAAQTSEEVTVPRSPVALAVAIRKRLKRSPRYWEQVQTAMQAAEAGLQPRSAQVESRAATH